MDNSKNSFASIALAFGVGAAFVALMVLLGARITGFNVGGAVLGFPDDAITPQPIFQPTTNQQTQQGQNVASVPAPATTLAQGEVPPTTSADAVGGYIPMTQEEAAALFGGPPARVWKQCPGEPLGACWTFALPGTSFRLGVPLNCLRPDGSIDGWRYLGGNPGAPDSIQGTIRVWSSLEAASIRCH